MHPFFFSIYPVLALYAFNIGQAAFRETLRPALVALAAAGLLFGLLRALVRDARRAGLAVTVVVLLFFSYGHIYYSLSDAVPGAAIGRADVLAALWAVGLVVLPWLCLRVLPAGAVRGLTPVLNITGAAALLLASVNIGAYWLRNGLPAEPAGVNAGLYEEPLPTPENAPDIYYLVVDTYGRQDVLQDLFQAGQQEFMQYLQDQGFVVAKASTSNYPQTNLSLASSLNMDYVDRLIPLRQESDDRLPLNQLIARNQAARFLKQRGYRTVFIASNFISNHGFEADLYLSPISMGNTLFEGLLLQGSMAILYFDAIPTPQLRQALTESLEMLHQQAAVPGPKFVVVYTTLLHSPYIFDANGSPIEAIGTTHTATPEGYFEGYPGQLAYTNKVLREAVQVILDSAEQPPVIVIQGDHGPAVYFDFAGLRGNQCLRERFAIMNAYYLPGVDAPVYDSITPVNTFRVIFNAYFGQDFEILPDRSYYSTWDLPYVFTDVTDRTDECAPLDRPGGTP